jgi:hypothetical protein
MTINVYIPTTEEGIIIKTAILSADREMNAAGMTKPDGEMYDTGPFRKDVCTILMDTGSGFMTLRRLFMYHRHHPESASFSHLSIFNSRMRCSRCYGLMFSRCNKAVFVRKTRHCEERGSDQIAKH